MQRVKGVSDEALIRREIYNPNEFDIRFELQSSRLDYLRLSGITPGPAIVICKAGGWCVLNHAYYVMHAPDKRIATFVQNFGDAIGKGNKKASNPYGEAQ